MGTTGIACGGPLRSVRASDSAALAPVGNFGASYPGSVWPHVTDLVSADNSHVAANVRPLPESLQRIEGWLGDAPQRDATVSQPHMPSATPVALQSPLRGSQARMPRHSIAAPLESTLPIHIIYLRFGRRNRWTPAPATVEGPSRHTQPFSAYATPAPATEWPHHRGSAVPQTVPVRPSVPVTDPSGTELQFRRPLGRRLSAAGLRVAGSPLGQPER